MGHPPPFAVPPFAAPPFAAPPIAVLLLSILGLGALAHPQPVRAGVLGPVLMLLRPQLEQRLAAACVTAAAGEDQELASHLQDPCRKLAVPTSKCLIEETDNTGRGLGVLTEMLGGRFGDDSEVVVKRCLAKLLGLPADSLREVPLQDLARRFGNRNLLQGSKP